MALTVEQSTLKADGWAGMSFHGCTEHHFQRVPSSLVPLNAP